MGQLDIHNLFWTVYFSVISGFALLNALQVRTEWTLFGLDEFLEEFIFQYGAVEFLYTYAWQLMVLGIILFFVTWKKSPVRTVYKWVRGWIGG